MLRGTRRPGAGTYAAALSNRSFRRALASYGLASAAQGMWSVALAVALYQQTGDAGWTAVAACLATAPLRAAVAARRRGWPTVAATGARSR